MGALCCRYDVMNYLEEERHGALGEGVHEDVKLMRGQGAPPCVQPVVDNGRGIQLGQLWHLQQALLLASQQLQETGGGGAVSYTHLTLPTKIGV